MKILFITLLFLAGCTSVSTQQTDADGKMTKVKIISFFDSAAKVNSLGTTFTDKSQSVKMKDIETSASSTNLNSLIEGVVGAAIKAAK